MAHDACTASATVAGGSPARPNTTRRPVSSCTATIHSGSAGHGRRTAPRTARRCGRSAAWPAGSMAAASEPGRTSHGARIGPGAGGPATPSGRPAAAPAAAAAGAARDRPAAHDVSSVPVTALRQRRGGGGRQPACRPAACDATIDPADVPTTQVGPPGIPTQLVVRSPSARRRGRRDRRCRRPRARRRSSGRPWRPVCPTRADHVGTTRRLRDWQAEVRR